MGWETGISLGAGALNSISTTNNALAQSKAIAQSADNAAANIANKTSRTEGTLETSFIKGGIALDDVGGTRAVFEQAGQQGSTDIQRTIANANASIANTMNEARTKALTGIASSFSKLGVGSIDSAVSTAYSGSWLESAWNGISGNPDPSPTTGPGLGGLY